MCFTRSVRKILGTKTGGGKTFKGRIWPVCCSVRHSRWLVACLGRQWPLGEIILGSHLCPDLSHKCCKELREGCFVSDCQEFFSYYVKPYATIDQASDSVFSQPNVNDKQCKKFLHLYNGNIIFWVFACFCPLMSIGVNLFPFVSMYAQKCP